MGSLNLNPRVWRLQPWDKNFNPYSQKNTSVQAWVCLWDLPWVYWHPQILADISIPLRFDQATINGDFGHYARVLVDIDLKNPLLYQIEVNSEGDYGFVNVEYENILEFCSTCSSIGHSSSCCKLNKVSEKNGMQASLGKAVGKKTIL